MISQKGQAIVEFVFVLPLFLVFLFGIIFMSMVFADYISMNDIARSCAREASYKAVTQANYKSICNKYSPDDLPAGIYTWTNNDFYISPTKDGQSINVHIYATLNENKGSVVPILRNVTSIKEKLSITIDYKMYKEKNNK